MEAPGPRDRGDWIDAQGPGVTKAALCGKRIRMTRAQRAERVGQILDELYPEPAIPLDHADPFTLLVAVMLSAQSTDKKVNEITPGLFALASTPAQMAQQPVARIQERIRAIGLAPTKAKNIRATAQRLVDDYDGRVPADLAALETLPGVGHKTASVVMAQAFGEPSFPVDTHIHRLAARWRLSDGSNVTKTEADLRRLFPRDTWNRRHLQIIYFGREHCPARGHDLSRCPICGWAASAAQMRREAAKR
jgi:endonuclease-3